MAQTRTAVFERNASGVPLGLLIKGIRPSGHYMVARMSGPSSSSSAHVMNVPSSRTVTLICPRLRRRKELGRAGQRAARLMVMMLAHSPKFLGTRIANKTR